MCGLVGLFGDITPELSEAFGIMLRLDVLRGEDSTGVAVVKPNNTVIVHKDVCNAFKFVRTADYIRDVHRESLKLALGHNRAATRGTVIRQNAHPFRHGNIVLAHNGTLTTLYDLRPLSKIEGHEHTDSEHICAAINAVGIEEAWKRVNGAAALTFYDTDKQTMNFITNGERPLNLITIEEINGETTSPPKLVAWASESWMFNIAAAKIGFPFSKYKFTSYALKKNILVSLSIQEDGVIKEKVSELTGYTPPPVTYTRYNSAFDDTTGLPVTRRALNTPFSGGYHNQSMDPKALIKAAKRLRKVTRRQNQKQRRDGLYTHYKPWFDAGCRLAQWTLAEDIFYNTFDVCSCCSDPIAGEFDEAILVPLSDGEHEVLCSTCANNWLTSVTSFMEGAKT